MTPIEALQTVYNLVQQQAEDDALWCYTSSIVEAYHQQELRALHAAVEAAYAAARS